MTHSGPHSLASIPPTLLSVFDALPNRLIATVHRDPDYDAIGSLLAFGLLINQLGRSITLYVPDLPPSLFDNLPTVQTITTTAPSDPIDMAFFLDCASMDRVARIDAFPSFTVGVNIDHHQDNSRFGDHQWVADISSVGEMMIHLYDALNQPISMDAATNIYAAMCFDTGHFKYPNTTSSTFRLASRLVDMGINHSQISEWVFDSKSPAYFNDIKTGLNHMYIDPNYPCMIVHLPYDSAESSPDSTVPFFRQLANIELIILCKEVAHQSYKLSFRSKQYVNVSKLASTFGGGGHIRAAGARCEAPFDELKATLLSRLSGAFE